MDASWRPYMLTFLWDFSQKALFFKSMWWHIETNFLNVFYSGSTYFIHSSSYSDWRKICWFYFILLLLHYHTYGFVASHPRENSPLHFLSHPIWVVHLYHVLKLSWLGTFRYDSLCNLLLYLLLIYFDRRISCLNILQTFLLLL